MPFKDKEYAKKRNKEYQKVWYKKHKTTHQKRMKGNRERIRLWFAEYKSKLKCELCGFSHVAALDFHHIDALDKDKNLSQMVGLSTSIPKIKEEIKKCQVLCSNCHRILHYNENHGLVLDYSI